MPFNPEPKKQASEVLISRKRKPINLPILYLNIAPVETEPFQKPLGLFLDEKRTFNNYLNE